MMRIQNENNILNVQTSRTLHTLSLQGRFSRDIQYLCTKYHRARNMCVLLFFEYFDRNFYMAHDTDRV